MIAQLSPNFIVYIDMIAHKDIPLMSKHLHSLVS